jgi:hypothetical protein
VELKSDCRSYGHWIGNKLREQAVGRHFGRAKTGSLGIANSNTDGITLKGEHDLPRVRVPELRGG